MIASVQRGFPHYHFSHSLFGALLKQQGIEVAGNEGGQGPSHFQPWHAHQFAAENKHAKVSHDKNVREDVDPIQESIDCLARDRKGIVNKRKLRQFQSLLPNVWCLLYARDYVAKPTQINYLGTPWVEIIRWITTCGYGTGVSRYAGRALHQGSKPPIFPAELRNSRLIEALSAAADSRVASTIVTPPCASNRAIDNAPERAATAKDDESGNGFITRKWCLGFRKPLSEIAVVPSNCAHDLVTTQHFIAASLRARLPASADAPARGGSGPRAGALYARMGAVA